MLKKHNIDLDNCRGQAYDGATAMSCALRGVAAIVSSQMKVPGSAPYTHCRSHCINLSVASACKERPIRQFMDDLTSLCYFFSNSPKRQQYFEEFIAKFRKELNVPDDMKKSKIIGLVKTLWVERHQA